MKRAILTAGLWLAVVTPAPALARPWATGTRLGCDRLVTVKRDEQAANRAYAGTRKATLRDLRRLGWMERCQRNPSASWFVRSYNRTRWQQHYRRIHDLMETAIASWYDDAGTHCCGAYATYGVATCGNQAPVCYPQGTRIVFYYGGRSVVAVVDDHGPYANGAAFDLNQNVKAALGFSGVQAVRYAIVR